jgi:hypothetical protein
MQELNIAVLGAQETGKSCFIRRALNLPNMPPSDITSRKMAIDGGHYIVRLLEMSFSDIHIGERSSIKWPETMDDLATPRIDGAVTIYDVAEQESLGQVPEVLSWCHLSCDPHLPLDRSTSLGTSILTWHG